MYVDSKHTEWPQLLPALWHTNCHLLDRQIFYFTFYYLELRLRPYNSPLNLPLRASGALSVSVSICISQYQSLHQLQTYLRLTSLMTTTAIP